MPSSSIAPANKEVKQVLDKADKPEKISRYGAYEHFTPVDVVAMNGDVYSVGAHQADYYDLVYTVESREYAPFCAC